MDDIREHIIDDSCSQGESSTPPLDNTDPPVVDFGNVLSDASIPINIGKNTCMIESINEDIKHPPEMPQEIIPGVLRRMGKLILTGCSKAAKSFLLMELVIAIAFGVEWLGFKVAKGRVLYINMELSSATCANRFVNIVKEMDLGCDGAENLFTLNLRGVDTSIKAVVDGLIPAIKDKGFIMVVIDPVYKLQSGDENSASSISAFCSQLDRLATETKCSVVYAHHHAKGNQSNRSSIDRSSGSGVFSRDADAILDIMELKLNQNKIDERLKGASAWRMEFTLREFKEPDPLHFYFRYPIHILDSDGSLALLPLKKAGSEKSDQRAKFDAAFSKVAKDGQASISDIADELDCNESTVYSYRSAYKEAYSLKKGIITKIVD